MGLVLSVGGGCWWLCVCVCVVLYVSCAGFCCVVLCGAVLWCRVLSCPVVWCLVLWCVHNPLPLSRVAARSAGACVSSPKRLLPACFVVVVVVSRRVVLSCVVLCCVVLCCCPVSNQLTLYRVAALRAVEWWCWTTTGVPWITTPACTGCAG